MEMILIDQHLLSELHEKAVVNERLRVNLDLRTTAEDSSQRMINSLEVGTHVPIHRHQNTSETVICIEGCLDWVFYKVIPNMDAERLIDNNEIAKDESCFKETARFRICPRDGQYGIQVPKGIWHSVVVYEPSTIFEAKDGKYETRKI